VGHPQADDITLMIVRRDARSAWTRSLRRIPRSCWKHASTTA